MLQVYYGRPSFEFLFESVLGTMARHDTFDIKAVATQSTKLDLKWQRTKS